MGILALKEHDSIVHPHTDSKRQRKCLRYESCEDRRLFLKAALGPLQQLVVLVNFCSGEEVEVSATWARGERTCVNRAPNGVSECEAHTRIKSAKYHDED